MSSLSNMIHGADFWVLVAFASVIVLSVRPLGRFLRNWGKGRAAAVQASLDESVALKQKAESLLAEYENKTGAKEAERAAILKQAEREVVSVKKDAAEKLSSRLKKQKTDMEQRLKSVKEQGQRELKEKLLADMMVQATKMLVQQAQKADPDVQMDEAIAGVFAALEKR